MSYVIHYNKDLKKIADSALMGARVVFSADKGVEFEKIWATKNIRLAASFTEIEPHGDPAGAIGAAKKTSEGGYIIWADESLSPGRKRFTLAHETAHVLLGHLDDGKTMFRDTLESIEQYRDNAPDDIRLMERDANYLAAELLMPREDILRVLGVADFGSINITDDAAKIKNAFHVSLEAAMRRLAYLYGYGA